MVLFIVLNFSACNNTKNDKTIKIGVIDSCISKQIRDEYNITNINDIVGIQTNNNITHGSKICYPAMYDGVISVSEGFNKQASVILQDKKVEFKIDGKKMKKREDSFLTAYVCGKIAKQLSEGNTVEEIVKTLNFD